MSRTTLQAIAPAKPPLLQKSFFILVLLFSFSTAFSFAVGADQRNYLLIGIMVVSCFMLVFTRTKFNSNESYVIGFYLSLMLCLVHYPETFRGSTLVYTLMFVLTFVFYLRVLHTGALRFQSYLNLLKLILFAYFFVLLIQQFCVISELPIFNFILGDSTEFRLNALSPEPSHSARIVLILFYSFICMRELELQRPYRLFSDSVSDRWGWLCFLYIMITMGSGTAFFLLALLLIRFISISTLFWGAGGGLIFLVGSFEGLNIPSLKRAILFGRGVLTSSPEQLAAIDLSAAIRVLPIYYYLEQVRFFSFDFWFGMGIDYNIKIFPMLIPGLRDDSSVGGIFPSLFLNHGMVAGILLILMVHKNCLSKFWSFSTLLAAVLIFSCGINTQITWLVFMLLATNLFFEHKKVEYGKKKRIKYTF